MKKILKIILFLLLSSNANADFKKWPLKCPYCKESIYYVYNDSEKDFESVAKKVAKETDIKLFGAPLEMRLKRMIKDIERILFEMEIKKGE